MPFLPTTNAGMRLGGLANFLPVYFLSLQTALQNQPLLSCQPLHLVFLLLPGNLAISSSCQQNGAQHHLALTRGPVGRRECGRERVRKVGSLVPTQGDWVRPRCWPSLRLTRSEERASPWRKLLTRRFLFSQLVFSIDLRVGQSCSLSFFLGWGMRFFWIQFFSNSLKTIGSIY